MNDLEPCIDQTKSGLTNTNDKHKFRTFFSQIPEYQVYITNLKPKNMVDRPLAEPKEPVKIVYSILGSRINTVSSGK